MRLFLAVFLLVPGLAWAQQQPGGLGGQGGGGAGQMGTPSPQASTNRAKPVPELAMDLVGDDDDDRLFAARELRRQAVWADQRAGEGELRNDMQLEARAALQDLRADVLGPARRAVVSHAKIRGAMADLLGALRDPIALPELQTARATEARKGVCKRLDQAILTLSAP